MRFPAFAPLITLLVSITIVLPAQDKIYTTKGDTLNGKVVEVWDAYIKYQKAGVANSPYYVVRNNKIDSIVYADGRSEDIMLQMSRKRSPNHLSSKNTLAFDLLGPVSNSMTLWYERRVWNGKLGIRLPLYLSYGQNYSPGYDGMRIGRRYIQSSQGFAIATGINPKFYLKRHKIVRVFAGPELDGGYSRERLNISRPYYTRRDFTHIFNFQCAGMAGININPFARFNVTIEGGAGYTFAFGKNFKQQNPTWRIGLSMGGNF